MGRILLVSLLVLPLGLCAQGRSRTLSTDSGTVVLHYFTNGHVSTKEWMDTDERWGHSWAYDPQGQVIVDHYTRKVAGHASVHFEYHPNGGVSKAEFSDAPDAGIQWYRSITTFDPNGQRTGFSEEGHDDHDLIPNPGLLKRTPEVPAPPVVEQRLFHNVYLVVNGDRKPCRVSLRPKAPSPLAQPLDATLLPGDTLRGGDFTLGEVWGDPLQQVAVTATDAKRRKAWTVVRVDTVQVSPEQRSYYLILRRKR